MVDQLTIFRVSAASSATKVASALAYALEDNPSVTLRVIGAGALSQAVKAVAIAQGYMEESGLVLYCRPGFTSVNVPDVPSGHISGMNLLVTASLPTVDVPLQ